MLLHTVKIETVYRKIKQIKEHMATYCLASDRAKLSIEDFKWTISDMYGLEIIIKEVAFEGEHLRGMVERYAHRARILLRADQPEDWLRFIAAKELCQLAIDEKEDWSPKGHETIIGMLFEASLDSGIEEERKIADRKVQSEKLAEIAAIEMMYPFEYRDNDLMLLREAKTTLRTLALHFHTPEYVVGTALHPGWMNIAKFGWGLVHNN